MALNDIEKSFWQDTVTDEYGAVFGPERHTLLFVPSNTREYAIPDGTVNIYHRCFADCKVLTRVTIPSSVKRIGNGAFAGCKSLEEIIIDHDINFLGYAAFRDCTSLKKMRLPDNINIIERELFYNCKSLESAVLPTNTKIILHKAFYGCSSLIHIRLNDNLINICESAFEKCTSLVEFIFPNSNCVLHENFLKDCTSLERIVLSSKLNHFNSCCCTGCTSLRHIDTIGEDLDRKKIMAWWKEGIGIQKNLKISDSCNPYPKHLFWEKDGMIYLGIPALTNVRLIICLLKDEEVTVPDFVTSIDRCAFQCCDKLRKLTISNKVIFCCYDKQNEYSSNSKLDAMKPLESITKYDIPDFNFPITIL